MGCGTGLCGNQIKNKYQSLTGIDISMDMLKKAKSNDKDKLINAVNSVKENFMPKVGAEISLPMRDLELRCQRLIGPKFMTIIKNIVSNITCKYIDTKEWEKFISGLQRLMGNGWNIKNVCLSLMNKNITNSIQFPDIFS